MGLLDQMRSFGQGASNSAASNVSAPIDAMAWLLRKGGLPIPQNPVGGSDWMAQRGLTAEPQNRLAGLLGEGFGGVAPIVAAAKAPQIAGGLLRMGENAAAATPLNNATRGQLGATVWHGSPHKFDKFDSGKIGTGEGAQAYGHGLYLAESPKVAGEYARMNITGPGQGAHIGKKHGPDGAMTALKNAYPKMPKLWYESAIAKADDVGNTYKVDLPDEHIAKMLDWDAPMTGQSDLYKQIAKEKELPYRGNTPKGGMDIYNSLIDQLGSPQAATDFLQKQGIPGIRYLDGGSRGAGAGSSNFVVFPGNENMLSILERNGKGLLAP